MSAYSCVKLFTSNFVDLNILANSDVSSEQTAFPVTNAYNLQRRSKVWRSQGYFKIESGSNTIIFTEGGADLTATVAAGEYTSTASFMTALDSAFTTATGAVGSYTITQDSNFKFVITKSAGTFVIKWTSGSSAAMAAILGFDTASNSTGALTYTADALRINTEEWILWDLGIASNPQAFMLCDQRNKPIKLSPNGVFKLQGNETNDFSSPSYQTTLTYDDQVISVVSDTGLHTEGLRYWRVRFLDENPLGYVQVGAFFLGQAFQPTRGRAQFPLKSDYIDRSENVLSEGGQSFSDIFEQTQQYNVDWVGLETDDVEDLTQLFSVYGTTSPFFISFGTTLSSSGDDVIKFVKFSNEPQFQLATPGNFTCSMSFIEQL